MFTKSRTEEDLDKPVFMGGPALRYVTDETSPYFIREDLRTAYLAECSMLSSRDIAWGRVCVTAARYDSLRVFLRDNLRAERGLGPIGVQMGPPNQGWAGLGVEAAEDGIAAYLIHSEKLIPRAIDRVKTEESDAAWRERIEIAGRCSACGGQGASVHSMPGRESDRYGENLCEPCLDTVSFLLVERWRTSASEKVGRRARSEIVAGWMASASGQ